MAKFSNGTEGMMYNEQFCEQCINWEIDPETDTPGCPIWDVHLLFDYEDNSLHNSLLDFLIPQSEFNIKQELCFSECKMFKTLEHVGITAGKAVEREYELASGETGIAKVTP